MNRHDRKRGGPAPGSTFKKQEAYRKRLKNMDKLREGIRYNNLLLTALGNGDLTGLDPKEIADKIARQAAWLAILESKPKVYLPPPVKYVGLSKSLLFDEGDDWSGYGLMF